MLMWHNGCKRTPKSSTESSIHSSGICASHWFSGNNASQKLAGCTCLPTRNSALEQLAASLRAPYGKLSSSCDDLPRALTHTSANGGGNSPTSMRTAGDSSKAFSGNGEVSSASPSMDGMVRSLPPQWRGKAFPSSVGASRASAASSAKEGGKAKSSPPLLWGDLAVASSGNGEASPSMDGSVRSLPKPPGDPAEAFSGKGESSAAWPPPKGRAIAMPSPSPAHLAIASSGNGESSMAASPPGGKAVASLSTSRGDRATASAVNATPASATSAGVAVAALNSSSKHGAGVDAQCTADSRMLRARRRDLSASSAQRDLRPSEATSSGSSSSLTHRRRICTPRDTKRNRNGGTSAAFAASIATTSPARRGKRATSSPPAPLWPQGLPLTDTMASGLDVPRRNASWPSRRDLLTSKCSRFTTPCLVRKGHNRSNNSSP
mmetsp:Transcript_62418/g.179518  ORF Transcript_62418/g.179518 Transcript_62418/m.179518 type:complete len:435 (+) Transcript_62418:402-1706(+)